MNGKAQEKDFMPKLFLTLPSPDQQGPHPINSTPVSYFTNQYKNFKDESANFSFGLSKQDDVSETSENLPPTIKNESSSPELMQLSSIFLNGSR